MTSAASTCPCGSPAEYQCHRCGRRICWEHYVSAPTNDGTATGPVCHPICGAEWWKSPKRSEVAG